MRRPLALLILMAAMAGLPLQAQQYNGPPPPKPDVPYLLHAENLIETEQAEAREQETKDTVINIVPGASSPVRTPLAEPIFIFLSDKIPAESLELYQMEVKGGNRQIAFPKEPGRRMRRGPWPVHLKIRQIKDKLYWIEANQYLENGEYCLSPQGSPKVFCFQIY